jgi:hypothetical protein
MLLVDACDHSLKRPLLGAVDHVAEARSGSVGKELDQSIHNPVGLGTRCFVELVIPMLEQLHYLIERIFVLRPQSLNLKTQFT